MYDENVAWYSDMAARHPALEPERQRRLLRLLATTTVRVQCWNGDPTTYLRRSREALKQYHAETAPLWLSENDNHAAWLDKTQAAARQNKVLLRRRRLMRKLRDQLLLHNQRMVIRIAHRKTPRGLDYGDLVMEGNMGLMRAVDLFDPRKNYRFSTYAHFWIEQSITLALKQKSHTVRTPLSALNRAWQDHKERQLEAKANPERAPQQPNSYGFSETLSLDDPDTKDLIHDEDSVRPHHHIDTRRLVDQLVKDLPERLLQVLTLRYGIDQRDAVGYREIADQLGISRERARQLEHEALQQVRLREKDSDASIF